MVEYRLIVSKYKSSKRNIKLKPRIEIQDLTVLHFELILFKILQIYFNKSLFFSSNSCLLISPLAYRSFKISIAELPPHPW